MLESDGALFRRWLEDAGSLLARWNRACPRHSDQLLRALIVCKEECFLFLDGSSEHKAVLVTAKQGFGPRGSEEISSIQLLIAEKLEQTAMVAVRA